MKSRLEKDSGCFGGGIVQTVEIDQEGPVDPEPAPFVGFKGEFVFARRVETEVPIEAEGKTIVAPAGGEIDRSGDSRFQRDEGREVGRRMKSDS